MSQNYREPVEATFTQWHNPLSVEQIVDIRDRPGVPPTRYRWKPGETKTLPSVYDSAIQVVKNGVIGSGKAPLLQRVGADYKVDPALDMFAAERKATEAAQAGAAYAKKVAEEALLIAAAKHEEAKTNAETKTPGKK